MDKQDAMILEAETFVRKALSHFPDGRADAETIKSAARKVLKSLPVAQKRQDIQP